MEFQTYRVHGRGGNRGGSEGVREGSLENDVFRPSFLPPFPCTTTIILGSVPRAPTYTSYTLFPPTFDDGSYTMAILGHGGWLQERGRNWAGRGETLTSSRGGGGIKFVFQEGARGQG